MFYVKTQLNKDASIQAGITSGNVFCACPHCGREVQVDLIALAWDDDFDLDCAVLCNDCGRKLLARHSEEVDA